MFKLGLAFCVVLGFASVANAGAVIHLTALTPPNAGDQYLGGTTVEFQAAISADADYPIQVRGLTLAFQDSSPELTFVGPDSNTNGVEELVWDFSSISIPGLYASFLDYPLPNVTYTSDAPHPGYILEIPVIGSLVLGTGSVVLPGEHAEKVTYFVDAFHASSTDTGMGDTARLDFDFANPTSWAANGLGDDLITGDALPLTVVPEPATLLLLGLGGLAVLRRRR